MSSAEFDCDSSLFHVLICMTDLCAQKSMHFLCLEPCETDKNVLKFGTEISLFAAGTPVSHSTVEMKYLHQYTTNRLFVLEVVCAMYRNHKMSKTYSSLHF